MDEIARNWSHPEADNEGDPPHSLRANLLREIVGNPWRPIVMDPAWPTPTVKALAQAAWDNPGNKNELDKMALGVLADALEDAGCASDEILRHLRSQFLCPACSRGKNIDEWYGGGGGWCAFCDRSGPDLHWMSEFDCPPGYELGYRVTHYRGCHVVDAILGNG